ncbi:MAG: DUF438 domain-containing protein [Thermoanaerobacteraceae bacterium]|nr:DUF438 domain-containing protein [Thermoanaerobacteraceae bacterium]
MIATSMHLIARLDPLIIRGCVPPGAPPFGVHAFPSAHLASLSDEPATLATYQEYHRLALRLHLMLHIILNMVLTPEQKLVEEGMNPEELRDLCSVHMEMLSGKLEGFKARLEAGSMLHTLVSEHDEILKFLDRLDYINNVIQNIDTYQPEAIVFKDLKHVATHLVETEKHHQREEDVLFPELEKRGISGPPRIMRMENDQLRPRKRRLKEISENVQNMNFTDFKNELTKFIVFNLRDHIFKENHILYPTAFEVINDPEVWEKMLDEADQIGYCCFTPGKQQ